MSPPLLLGLLPILKKVELIGQTVLQHDALLETLWAELRAAPEEQRALAEELFVSQIAPRQLIIPNVIP